MSHGESVTTRATPSSSAKTTTTDESPSSSSKGSRSRRGGGRTTSSPSTRRPPSPPPARIDTAPYFGSIKGTSTLLAPPPQLSVTAPTPEPSPITPGIRRGQTKSTPTMPTKSVLRTTPTTPPAIEKSHSSGSGKRKAEEAGVGGDKTPPKEGQGQRATFAPDPRTHRASATSNSSGHAPSSFNRSKRVRLTESSEGGRSSRSGSRGGTLPTPEDSPPNAKTTGSWSSRGSHGVMSSSSHSHVPPPIHHSHSHGGYRAPSRRTSISQASIPISALVSPHAPSVETRTSTFHMRDPRKPPPIQTTPWSLTLPSVAMTEKGESRWALRGWVDRGGSPLHAWLFFIGFVVFPLWWAAALAIPIPKTRRLGGSDAEKGVILDDPQVEHDAKSWRFRCRIMAVVSLFTYIPFIALVAVYA